jgi:hypothetical protein
LAKEYGVNGYPTLLLFSKENGKDDSSTGENENGKTKTKSGHVVTPYDGPRSLEALVTFLNKVDWVELG